MIWPFKRKKQVKPCCGNCAHYNKVRVQGNRLEDIMLGLCDNKDVRSACVPYGRTANGFYRWDWPGESPFGPVSFDPEFSCKHFKPKQ
jgi:hypothetical protein